MTQSGEHHRVVILELAELILQSDYFEALSTDLTSVNGAFSYHIEDLFVGVCIIFDTWTHADDDSPG